MLSFIALIMRGRTANRMIIETCFLIVTFIELAFIAFMIMYLFDHRDRIERLESSYNTLRGSVNRLADDDDELGGRVWKLEHKDGEQNG